MIENSYGASFIYRFDNSIEIGAAFNEADISSNLEIRVTNSDKDKTYAASISYGELDVEGWFAAAVYVQSENHETDYSGNIFDAKGYEAIALYTFTNKVGVYEGFNTLKEDD